MEMIGIYLQSGIVTWRVMIGLLGVMIFFNEYLVELSMFVVYKSLTFVDI